MNPIWVVIIPIALFLGYQLYLLSPYLKEERLSTPPKGEPANPDDLWGDYLYLGKYPAFYVGESYTGQFHQFRVKGITDPNNMDDVVSLTDAGVRAYITTVVKD